MHKKSENVAVLIPSLEPDDRLIGYVSSLLNKGFLYVVVVDDGSNESYQYIFDTLSKMGGCTVLHHTKNMGKGRALKTGFKYIYDNYKDCKGVITVDADGQHSIADVFKLAASLSTNKQALYLGSRDFSINKVPVKSRLGNRITSVVFCLLHGQWLPDTQTGLRAFGYPLLVFMDKVEGSRFEYEMNVLIACSRERVPMIPITIETIYENENKGSHFHPIRDSIRIYRLILKDFFKYTSASLITAVIDIMLFWLLLDLAGMIMGEFGTLYKIGFATVTARFLSATINFLLNKKFVFKIRLSGKGAILKYTLLCIASTSLSAVLVTLFHNAIGIDEKIVKIVCDTCIFFLNFTVQKKWIFASKRTTEFISM